MLSEIPLRLAFAKLVSALATSLTAFSALNKLPIHFAISEPYADSNVIPITSAACQEKILPNNCFQTGIAVNPSAFIRLNSSLALLNSSANIGKLLEIARKNWLKLIVRDGSSRNNCCVWTFNPFHEDA